jgi:hypothetical protein
VNKYTIKNNISSFFDSSYKTPKWLSQSLNNKLSRRSALKSAAGALAIASMPVMLNANTLTKNANQLHQLLATDPWRTLNAVLNHLLPQSPTGPSAKEINATQYLYNVVFEQPTDQVEIDFIYRGVGWLNGYTQSQLQQNFVLLSDQNKEKMLRSISRSEAGDNWINNLINYLYEAMLSPPIYGGNPNGIGWQWLEHHGGYPLPKMGNRYYELPGQQKIDIVNIPPTNNLKAGQTKS